MSPDPRLLEALGDWEGAPLKRGAAAFDFFFLKIIITIWRTKIGGASLLLAPVFPFWQEGNGRAACLFLWPVGMREGTCWHERS